MPRRRRRCTPGRGAFGGSACWWRVWLLLLVMLITCRQQGGMMVAKTVGIAVADDLRPALDEVVEHFGHGNRSEFLRLAVRDFQGRLRLERMHALREQARAERDGRRYSADEVLRLIRETAAA